jgi:hypothetical protein
VRREPQTYRESQASRRCKEAMSAVGRADSRRDQQVRANRARKGTVFCSEQSCQGTERKDGMNRKEKGTEHGSEQTSLGNRVWE